jgi:hypothetical protein
MSRGWQDRSRQLVVLLLLSHAGLSSEMRGSSSSKGRARAGPPGRRRLLGYRAMVPDWSVLCLRRVDGRSAAAAPSLVPCCRCRETGATERHVVVPGYREIGQCLLVANLEQRLHALSKQGFARSEAGEKVPVGALAVVGVELEVPPVVRPDRSVRSNGVTSPKLGSSRKSG